MRSNSGVDHIDTAQFYGPDVANELIREALHPYPDDLALVSKVGARRDDKGAWIPASKPDELRADIEENLRELGVDQLAAVNLRIHNDDDPSAPTEVDRDLFDRQLTAMIAAREEGLIAGIGLSSITLDHLEIALERTEIVTVQNAYNLVERSSQAGARRVHRTRHRFRPVLPARLGVQRRQSRAGQRRSCEQAATDLGRTPAQIALAWTLSVAPNVLLIPGTSSVEHLEENLAVADIDLPDEVKTKLDALA